MIRRIVHFALHQPLFAGLLAILFAAGGIVAFINLPIEAFPDVSDTQVNVIALFSGRAPEEVEKQVTIPLETVLSGVPHSVRLFSHTQFGLSFIMITFDDKVTDSFVRQQVLERLRTADLPPGVQPEIAPLSTAIGEIYRYRLKGEGYNPRDLRTLEDWVVERNLRMVPGVADIVGMGGAIKTYEVNPDLGKLRDYGLSLQQLYTALSRGNANVGGSKVEQGPQQYLIRGLGLLRSPDDIGGIVLASRHGVPVHVRDAAEVKIGNVPREGIVGQDGEDDVVTGIVLMRKGENPSEVLKALKARIALLNRSVLPKGAQIVSFYDRAWLITTTLHTVFKNLAEGAMLVTLVLLLFLGNFRVAFIVALMIPLSLLATFVGLTWRGIPANLLSLGAMDFGIIVDGAVIVAENIFRKLSEQDHSTNREKVRELILGAAAEVGRPTFFSMLIIIVAHIPIFTLQRHEGRIFAPMAWTVTSALVGWLLFSMTLVPLLCFYLLGRGVKHDENALVDFCRRVYRRVLEFVLARPIAVFASALVAFVGAAALAPALGTEFLPELNEGTMWVNVLLPPSVSVAQASKICAQIRRIIRGFPEVTQVISQTGRPEDGTDPKTINMAEFFVDLKPPSEWPKNVTREDLAAQIEDAVDRVPGLDPAISQPIRDNVLESISQIDGQIVIKVFGDDPAQLRDRAGEVLRVVSGIRGVSRAFIDRFGQIPQLQIEVDRPRAARYGLNVADVEDVIDTALGGRVAT